MAETTVLDLLETLETHLEQTKAKLSALREENEMLKRQLADQVPQSQPSSQPLHSPSQPDPFIAEPLVEDARPSSELPDTQVTSEAAATEASLIGAVSVEKIPDDKVVTDTVTTDKVTIDKVITDKVATESVIAEKGTAEPAPQPPSPQALLRQWYKRYPHAFFTGHTKPLKVGIHQDLAQCEPWSGKLIRRALANYVNLPRYVKSMREGAERIDLDGNPAGKVDKEAARHASERRKDKQDSNPSKQAPPSENRKPRQPSRQTPQKVPNNPGSTPEKVGVQGGRGEAMEKAKTANPLSLEDKLRGLQQKFTGR